MYPTPSTKSLVSKLQSRLRHVPLDFGERIPTNVALFDDTTLPNSELYVFLMRPCSVAGSAANLAISVGSSESAYSTFCNASDPACCHSSQPLAMPHATQRGVCTTKRAAHLSYRGRLDHCVFEQFLLVSGANRRRSDRGTASICPGD